MSGKQPLLSVIMAVYNGGRTLQKTLDSLEEQTWQDFELIVVDDGSDDDTWQIITTIDRSYIRAHRNVTNRGQTPSLNHALEMAVGKYIARHDAEDISHRDRFRKQIEYLNKRPKVAAVGCQIDWLDGAGNLVRHFEYPTAPKEVRQRLKTHNSLAHGAVMARRDVLNQLGGYREAFRLAQDYDLWLRVAEAHQVGNLPDTLYSMRFSRRMASVARNAEQNAYAALARQLAEERARSGGEVTNLAEASAVLEAHYQGNPVTRRVERARNYVAWAERLLWWGEPAARYAWPMWQYALTAWPFSLRVWRFAGREVIKVLSNPSEANESGNGESSDAED